MQKRGIAKLALELPGIPPVILRLLKDFDSQAAKECIAQLYLILLAATTHSTFPQLHNALKQTLSSP